MGNEDIMRRILPRGGDPRKKALTPWPTRRRPSTAIYTLRRSAPIEGLRALLDRLRARGFAAPWAPRGAWPTWSLSCGTAASTTASTPASRATGSPAASPIRDLPPGRRGSRGRTGRMRRLRGRQGGDRIGPESRRGTHRRPGYDPSARDAPHGGCPRPHHRHLCRNHG